MKVLLVEDSERLRRYVSTALKRTGYTVDQTGDGAEGLWLASNHRYDAVVLDVMLPGMDGLNLLGRLRAERNPVHVLVVTARESVAERVEGLARGADDYLVKPFDLQELLARVHALCRRSGEAKTAAAIECGNVKVDVVRKLALVADRMVNLARREYLLLEYLALRRGRVVSRPEIEAEIYDTMADPMSNVVESSICSLRRQLTAAGAPPIIHTKRGRGYVFDLEGA